MYTKRHAALVSLVPVLGTATVLACSCLPSPPPKHALQQAAAVFLGTVTEIGSLSRNGKDPRLMKPVTFRVIGTWKGSNAVSRIVHTGQGGGDCGYRFVLGSNYLVYAYRMSATNLATGICSRTCSESRAADDLKALGVGQKPEKK